MRPDAPKNRKVLRFAHLLGLPLPYAVGLLELLWNTCYIEGDDVIGDMTDIKLRTQYPDDPAKLRDALLSCGGSGLPGLIDEVEGRPGVYAVHDFWTHAPQYVQRRAQREIARQATGESLRDARVRAGKSRHKASQSPASGQQVASQVLASGQQTAAHGHNSQLPSPNTLNTKYCPEPPRAASVPAAADSTCVSYPMFPVVGKGSKSWALDESQLAEWAQAFPGVDVAAEAVKAHAWIKANPTKRKTAAGMPRFLVSWLGRAQNSQSSGQRPARGHWEPPSEHPVADLTPDQVEALNVVCGPSCEERGDA